MFPINFGYIKINRDLNAKLRRDKYLKAKKARKNIEKIKNAWKKERKKETGSSHKWGELFVLWSRTNLGGAESHRRSIKKWAAGSTKLVKTRREQSMQKSSPNTYSMPNVFLSRVHAAVVPSATVVKVTVKTDIDSQGQGNAIAENK